MRSPIKADRYGYPWQIAIHMCFPAVSCPAHPRPPGVNRQLAVRYSSYLVCGCTMVIVLSAFACVEFASLPQPRPPLASPSRALPETEARLAHASEAPRCLRVPFRARRGGSFAPPLLRGLQAQTRCAFPPTLACRCQQVAHHRAAAALAVRPLSRGPATRLLCLLYKPQPAKFQTISGELANLARPAQTVA
jgi:hypothetical protein